MISSQQMSKLQTSNKKTKPFPHTYLLVGRPWPLSKGEGCPTARLKLKKINLNTSPPDPLQRRRVPLRTLKIEESQPKYYPKPS
jgi:hypothetical protein